MKVAQVSGPLVDPGGAGWASVAAAAVALAPMPIDAQPTEYIRTKWAGKEYGTVREATVAAAHDGSRLYVRLEWADSATPNGEFADGAAACFPASAGAPAATVGSADQPVNVWFWEADLAEARSLEARGPGVFRPRGRNGVRAAAALDGGRWAVVLEGDLADARAGGALGVAVWDGSNEERAGIGAVTHEWIPLELD